MKRYLPLLFTTIFLLANCTPTLYQDQGPDLSQLDRATRKVYAHVADLLAQQQTSQATLQLDPWSKIDTLILDRQNQTLAIYFNSAFANIPFREDNTAAIYRTIQASLGRRYQHYTLSLFARQQPLSALIPNYYRPSTTEYDETRRPAFDSLRIPLIRNLSSPWQPTKGLYTRNIALWPSHGWYYEQKLDRWEWQRARVFQTVEDLLPLSFVLPYVAPMLEKAGAQVWLPRERDIQTHEVIVDNDTPTATNLYLENSHRNHTWQAGALPGFAVGTPPYVAGDNPFNQGSYRSVAADTTVTASIQWVPNIPEAGRYAVYIAYAAEPDNITDAHYTVTHAGGRTRFLVNQQSGGSTWIYLGSFQFKAGRNPETASVTLTNQSREKGVTVTADAVRFGGGMGNIARNGQISGRPRFEEGARYYLQYAGMPDTLVYNLNHDSKDYNDDYQCRGEWVNYLKGAPFGPNRDRNAAGLRIPIDLSLGFHTDAGTTRNDTVIGTLSIYATTGADETTFFPDSMSRMANRDFADILQTQIVNDIRAKYYPAWNRRQLWDRGYSEAYRPNVPAALLELLSHHNFLDMKFGLDPRFRFDASRSIYKAMLRFLATQYDTPYIVEPLPISHFRTRLLADGQVTLDWQATTDPLEPSAKAEKYIVYTRKGDGAFDNGTLVSQNTFTAPAVKPGIIYSYQVSAVNDGGESFPSEILSVCNIEHGKQPVLIINGFDRVSAPATLETAEYLGFANFWDQGVPDRYDFNFIGDQYDFLADSPWLDDDAPGHGASRADYETTIIAGNTFDYPYLHGKSIQAAGHSFVSASNESVMDQEVDLNAYRIVDLILGEEKLTPGPKPIDPQEFRAFPKTMQTALTDYCQAGGDLFISGAYVGTDLFENRVDSADIDFAQEILKFKFRTNHAVNQGGVHPVQQNLSVQLPNFAFNTAYRSDIYGAESPDALEPSDSSATTILRYDQTNASAGVAAYGDWDVVVFGFPFETIMDQTARDQVMQGILASFTH